jgi:hypothetical protein
MAIELDKKRDKDLARIFYCLLLGEKKLTYLGARMNMWKSFHRIEDKIEKYEAQKMYWLVQNAQWFMTGLVVGMLCIYVRLLLIK